jgi:hypothetical protein
VREICAREINGLSIRRELSELERTEMSEKQ